MIKLNLFLQDIVKNDSVQWNGGLIKYKGDWLTEQEVKRKIALQLLNPTHNNLQSVVDTIRETRDEAPLDLWAWFHKDTILWDGVKPKLFELFPIFWLPYVLADIVRNKNQLMYFFCGVPKAGKSIIMKILQDLFGEKYTCVKQLNALGGRFGFSGLQSKLLLCADDLGQESIDSKDSGTVKTLITGGRIEVNEKHKKQYSTDIVCNSVFGCNIKPTYDVLDTGNHRRFAVCWFNNELNFANHYDSYSSLLEGLLEDNKRLKAFLYQLEPRPEIQQALVADTVNDVFKRYSYIDHSTSYTDYKLMTLDTGHKPYNKQNFEALKKLVLQRR